MAGLSQPHRFATLFLLAALPRVLAVIATHSDPVLAARVVAPDALNVYLPLAANVVAGHGFVLAADVTAPLTVPPVYPLWLAALQGIVGAPTPLVVGLLQAALRSLSVAAVFGIGLRLLPPAAALWAAVLYLLDPWEAFWIPYLLKESVAVPLLLVAVGVGIEAAERPTAARAALAGTAVALATLAWFGAAVLTPWLAWLVVRGEAPARRLAAGAAGAAVVATAWAALIVAPLPEFAWSDAPNRALIRFVSRPLAPGAPVTGYSPDRPAAALEDWDRAAAAGPAGALRLMLERVPRNLGRAAVNLGRPVHEGSSTLTMLVFGVPYLLTLSLAAAGLVLARRGRLELAGLPGLLSALVVLLLLTSSGVRQRQYLSPLLALPAGLALASLGPRLTAATSRGRTLAVD